MSAEKTENSRRVALIGVPTDVGAGHRGGSMGPEALRVAGIDRALERLGQTVIDHGNLTGPSNPNGEVSDGIRHIEEVAIWCRSVRDAVTVALEDGSLPIVLGGDHSMSIGSVAAIARYCHERDTPLAILWLDAHSDTNTAQTTVSGNLHGMPVAVLTGQGPERLTRLGHASPVIGSQNIVQIGVRSVDRKERDIVADSGLQVFDMRQIDEVGMRRVMERALELVADIGGHLHVSFDVDFLDPAIAPGVATSVPGGPGYREAQLAMEMIHDSGLMASLDLMELNPAFDDRNRTAELVVELVESLFGEQILNRHKATI